MRRVFLDIGHEYGAREGCCFNGIQEGAYNDDLASSIETLWRTRVSLENLLSLSKLNYDILTSLNIVVSLPYMLIRSNTESEVLVGDYEQRADEFNEQEMGDVVVQMHLSEGNKSESVIGFNQDSPWHEISLALATIAAEELDAFINKTPELISSVQVFGCTGQSENSRERRIHFSIKDYEVPVIYIAPLCLDNEHHYAYLSTEEGRASLVKLYASILERIGTICLN
jgi:hypothetical protein